MAKKQSAQSKKKPKPICLELADNDLDPDAWEKFEKLIKSASGMGPKPRKGRGDGGMGK